MRQPLRHTHNAALILVVVSFVALCCYYNYATPLFEGLDEGAHYNYVDILASHKALPDLNSDYIRALGETHKLIAFETDPNALGHEITQPPLYYALGAALIFWIDRTDFASVHKTADSMSHGMAYFHTSAELDWPPTGTVLAVRIVRLLSTLLGAAIVILVCLIALRLTQRSDVAVLASVITAFNPKLIHLSSVITNDIAVACAFTLTLCFAVLLITETKYNPRRAFVLSLLAGAAAGLTVLSKLSGLAVLMPTGIALIWHAWKFRRAGSWMRGLSIGIVSCAVGFAAVAGWYFVYNTVIYGNPLAWEQVQRANAFAFLGAPLTLPQLLDTVPMLFRTYWGVFGDGIQSPVLYDIPMWIIAGVGAIGLLIAALRKRVPAEFALLMISSIASVIVFVAWLRLYATNDNSRHLMSMSAPVSIALAIGLLQFIPARGRDLAARFYGLAALGWAIFIPSVSLLPNYNPLTYLSNSQIAQLPEDGQVVFDNGIELTAAVLESNRIDPGSSANLSVYWRATRPITQSYATVLEAFNDAGQSLGRLTTEGFLGRQYVTPEWEVGRVIKMNYQLNISATRQTLARVYAGWYAQDSGRVSRVQNRPEVSAQIATVKVRGMREAQQLPPKPIQAFFGDAIQLQGYSVCSDTLTLYWHSSGAPPKNYTVFAHALNSQGSIVAQSDAPVAYPTLFWDNGEQILDPHVMPGLARAAALDIGLYDPLSQNRLPATRPDSSPLQDNVLHILIETTAVCQ